MCLEGSCPGSVHPRKKSGRLWVRPRSPWSAELGLLSTSLLASVHLHHHSCPDTITSLVSYHNHLQTGLAASTLTVLLQLKPSQNELLSTGCKVVPACLPPPHNPARPGTSCFSHMPSAFQPLGTVFNASSASFAFAQISAELTLSILLLFAQIRSPYRGFP